MSAVRWVDNHCHLPADPVQAREVVAAARESGVARLVDVGTDLGRSAEACERASVFEEVYATVGLHPHDAVDGLDGFDELYGLPGVVAVGECGLDYYYEHSPRDVQRQVFAQQVQLAHQLDLALVIHTRDAWDDTFDVLDAEGTPQRTVFHCFTGGPDEARAALDRGGSGARGRAGAQPGKAQPAGVGDPGRGRRGCREIGRRRAGRQGVVGERELPVPPRRLTAESGDTLTRLTSRCCAGCRCR